MKQRILLLLTALCMLVCAAPLSACTPAEEPWPFHKEKPGYPYENGEFAYLLHPESGEVTITDYLGLDEEVVIPAELDGYPVTAVASFLFNEFCQALVKSVILPDGLIQISEYAFCNSALQTITIPDSVQYIGKSAFSGTPWLEAQTDEFVIVGEGVLIDYNSPAAKAGANTAGEVVEMAIPDGVKCISFSFDESTVERYEVTIPASVRSIEDKAFCNASIESIRFEEGVQVIGQQAFDGALRMEKLVLPDSLLYIGDRAFRGNESLHTVILGGRTKSIGAYAFASCTNLEKIEIPSSVQHIGSYAFLYTAFGNHLVNDYTGFVTLGDGVLVAYNGKEKDIVVPEGITSITGAFFNTPVESVTLPSTLRIVGDYAFCQATALKNVYFSKFSSPDEIGDHAFEGCKALQTIALPDSVTKIGNDAFANCTSLERIVLPNGVQSIGSSAFFDCDKLTDLHFPAGLKSIGSRAFNGCASLTGIQLPDSVYSIGNYAFYNCKQLTTVRFPAGLTEISSGLFSSCSQLQAVTLPDTVQKIGANAFWGCTELEQITLSRHLQDIGLDAFYKTKYLNELHKRDGAFAVCNHVLIGYDGETSEVVVPDGIERIAAPFARDPFDNPTETPITSLVFPDSVTEIDKYALRNCSELRELTFGDGVRTISGELLIHCSKLEKVTFGRGLTCIEPRTTSWPKNALLYVPAGSYALDWAREHGFTYRVMD